MRVDILALLFGCLLSAVFRIGTCCTVFGVGQEASTDGSTLTGHSDDAEYNGDGRLCRVPAGTYKKSAMRPVYWESVNWPRKVANGLGPCYTPKPGQELSKPICEIPQVEKTYSYFEGSYPIMNEHGLGMSESTCSGMFTAKPKTMGGGACLGIMNLGELALERTKTAKEGVQLMGDMAVKYGFYGGDTFEGGAESLVVNDKDEVWIFHVLPDDTATSAIWVAQRIPKGHVTVIANMFMIREIDFDSPDFLYSDSVKSIAKKLEWWKEGEPFDFTKIYSAGEYSHKYYTGRRMWGAYLKWGLEFPDNYTDLRYDAVYPVSAKPKVKTEMRDLFSTYRWSYEGTKYDMSQGLAAGPWGITDRWNNQQNIMGAWERSIAVYRTDYYSLTQTNSKGGVLWFGPHCSHANVFVPLDATCTSVPDPYMSGNPTTLTRKTAYWAHKYSFNVAYMKFNQSVKTILRKSQNKYEDEGVELVSKGASCDDYYQHMDKVWKGSWSLPDLIVATYADGWYKDDEGAPYPDWWLKAVGYPEGPPLVPDEPDGPCYPHPCPNGSADEVSAHALRGTLKEVTQVYDQGPLYNKDKIALITDSEETKLVEGPSYFELVAELEAANASVQHLEILTAFMGVITIIAVCVAILYACKSKNFSPLE